MIFHFGFDLPRESQPPLDHGSPHLTHQEIEILQEQIRKNALLVDEYVQRLDLLVNKERYPKEAPFVEKIRRRLYIAMEENDTFRKVLWRHVQKENLGYLFHRRQVGEP